MIEVRKHGILLSKTDLEFENECVLNPAVIREGDNVHIFYRAVSIGNHSSLGYCRLDGPLTIAERWDKPFMVHLSLIMNHREWKMPGSRRLMTFFT
jgi:beta-1,2-mannobiose phosphorylase / 1,2-beta-oligomannan phosphorylase